MDTNDKKEVNISEVSKVLNFLLSLWQNNWAMNIIVIGLVSIIFLKQCNQISDLENEVDHVIETANRNLNNYKAANDTVRILELSNKEKAATILSYEFDIANLKDSQSKLISKYNDVLDINKDLDMVNMLLFSEIKIKDSLLALISIDNVDSTTDKVIFDRFDDFGNGNTRHLTGNMLVYKNGDSLVYDDAKFSIQQEISLHTSIEDTNGDGQDEVKITTEYPGLAITDIENINLINSKLNRKYVKKDGWSIGLGIGYGVNLNNNQVISYGPSLGVGLYWSPKWLRF